MAALRSLLEDARLELRFDLGVEDAELDVHLNDLIARGQAYLNGKMGVVVDYDEDTNLRALLMGYVRYAYNDATEQFLTNFYDDIFSQQIQYAIKDREENANANQQGTQSGSSDSPQPTN